MDKQALEYAASMIVSGMAAKYVNEQTDGSAVPLPESVKVEDLERFMPNRRRYRGTMTTTQIDQFAEYTNRTAGEVQANGEEPGATVRSEEHTSELQSRP